MLMRWPRKRIEYSYWKVWTAQPEKAGKEEKQSREYAEWQHHMGAGEHGRPTTPYHRGGTETAQETNLVSNG